MLHSFAEDRKLRSVCAASPRLTFMIAHESRFPERLLQLSTAVEGKHTAPSAIPNTTLYPVLLVTPHTRAAYDSQLGRVLVLSLWCVCVCVRVRACVCGLILRSRFSRVSYSCSYMSTT